MGEISGTIFCCKLGFSKEKSTLLIDAHTTYKKKIITKEVLEGSGLVKKITFRPQPLKVPS